MFTRPTVFVIGAGAGEDIGMPLGSEMTTLIQEYLDFRQGKGNGDVYDALRGIANQHRHSVDDYTQASHRIRKGIGYPRSIDNYLRMNSHDLSPEQQKDFAMKNAGELVLMEYWMDHYGLKFEPEITAEGVTMKLIQK